MNRSFCVLSSRYCVPRVRVTIWYAAAWPGIFSRGCRAIGFSLIKIFLLFYVFFCFFCFFPVSALFLLFSLLFSLPDLQFCLYVPVHVLFHSSISVSYANARIFLNKVSGTDIFMHQNSVQWAEY